MKLRRTVGIKATIPSASMGDIAFLLIIFFIVTTTFSVDKTKVNLPQSLEREATVPGAAIIVIDSEGQVFLSTGDHNPEPSGIDDITIFAHNLVARTPQMQFTIKASRDVEYRYVDKAIEQLRDANARNISLLTLQKVRSSTG
ncbi:MAG: biopolymer transporter ExbD [Candidatus Coatesbacteria bacterium]|nr:biopolymer transporter ExbD [Candidatus Coatesbacteria bacterium]